MLSTRDGWAASKKKAVRGRDKGLRPRSTPATSAHCINVAHVNCGFLVFFFCFFPRFRSRVQTSSRLGRRRPSTKTESTSSSAATAADGKTKVFQISSCPSSLDLYSYHVPCISVVRALYFGHRNKSVSNVLLLSTPILFFSCGAF